MDVARHLNGAGVTCFVLRYRLPGEGWANRSDVPLQDAQRAMRLVRANAGKYGIDTGARRLHGFFCRRPCRLLHRHALCGARLCAAGCRRQPWMRGPAFRCPCIPSSPWAKAATRVRATICWAPIRRRHRSMPIPARRHVPADAPPTWICLAADDTTVPPIQNGVAYFTALRARQHSRRDPCLRCGRPWLRHRAHRGQAGCGVAGPVAALGRKPRLLQKRRLIYARSYDRLRRPGARAQSSAHRAAPRCRRRRARLFARWRRNSRAPGRPL